MDETRFDVLTRSLGGERSRRGVARLVAGVALGSIVARGAGDAAAKRRGKGKKRKKPKVTVCHQGQTSRVTKSALQAYLAHGDIWGSCGCVGRQENDECQDVGVTGVCCGGVCTQLNTLNNCRSCGDACETAGDICGGLDSGGDPESGCCASIYTLCDPQAADRCCNASTCTGKNLTMQDVCCGTPGSSCSIPGQCCSGICTGPLCG